MRRIREFLQQYLADLHFWQAVRDFSALHATDKKCFAYMGIDPIALKQDRVFETARLDARVWLILSWLVLVLAVIGAYYVGGLFGFNRASATIVFFAMLHFLLRRPSLYSTHAGISVHNG